MTYDDWKLETPPDDGEPLNFKSKNMIINLKKLSLQKENLKRAQSLLRSVPEGRPLVRNLNNLILFLNEIEIDLELGGESIVELDMSRLDAVEQRNKMLNFLNEEDD